MSHCLGEWSTFLVSATLQRTQTWASYSNFAFFFFNLTAKVFILRGERDLTGLPNSFYLSGDVKVAQDRPVLHLTRAFTFK